MNRLVIFGTSCGYENLLPYMDKSKYEIIAFLDNNPQKVKLKVDGIEIFPPEQVLELQFDYVLLTSTTYQKEMLNQLLDLGVLYEKIIIPSFLYRKTVGNLILNQYNQFKKESSVFKDEFASKNMHFGLATMNKYLLPENIQYYNYPDYSLNGIDYIRLAATDLIAREIINNNIGGAVAELGVYKGDFSKYLGDLFLNREILLFDTFEGFNTGDVSIERQFGFSSASEGVFNDTNVDMVLKKIRNRDRVTVIKGYFPESVAQLKEDKKYAFVSIDVDLYQPILEGLKYFYERLEVGGYIIIHDYNFAYYNGVKKAVEDFRKLTGVQCVPIPDYHGSAVIVKQELV